ncbi:MAG: sigma-70 family RNA polymerase sigma factor [Anaerolineae bacterium]|nr:sigma-70 family RNA polymerase sigma factor [Anaerolineae bacterium]MBL6966118.1 sigma-70 family RNA polymerase sigma factor [Anaerolineales bacterium]
MLGNSTTAERYSTLATYTEFSDDQVVERASLGDLQAFGELYDRYVQRIYNYIYFRTGNTFDAEDLTERVFFRAIQHIKKYENRGLPIAAWLYRIAHNLVANWYRDNSRRQEIPLDAFEFSLTFPGDLPETAMLKAEEQNDLLCVIRQLPEERQQLLILKFVEQLTNAEIGQIMGRTEGAIKSLYHRTLLALRKEYNIVGVE